MTNLAIDMLHDLRDILAREHYENVRECRNMELDHIDSVLDRNI